MAVNESPLPKTTDTLAPLARKVRGAEIGVTRAYVEEFVRSAYAAGPDAAFEYERALAVIRKAPQEVVIEIAQALGECAQHDYPRRWALIFAATELRHRAALPLLVTIVEAPLLPEPQPPSHGFSVVAQETILRTTAIEGIGHFAKDGDEQAIEALFRALRPTSISMRRAAVQALLSSKKGKGMRARITSYLPPENHFLLELKTPKVTAVAQVKDPERFLSDEARQSSSLKAPQIPEARGSEQTRPPKSGEKENPK